MKYLSLSLCFCFMLFNWSLTAQEEEYGLSSYYSDDFQGRSTAYGDTYNKDELTCAHKRYPYGTMLRVTRLDTKKSVNVKVIDKGPFIKGRVVDLSRRAAEVLGIIGMGPVEVKVEKVGNAARNTTRPAEVVSAPAETPRTFDEPAPERITTSPPPAAENNSSSRSTTPATPAERKPTVAAAERVDKVEETTARTTKPSVREANDRFSLVGEDFSPYGLYRIVLEKPDERVGYGVQVASLSNYENVLKQVAELQAKWFDNVLVSIEPGEGGKNQYKVILGPLEDQRTAQRYQQDLLSRYRIRGFVVNLAELSY